MAFTVCQQHGIPNVIRSINEAMQRIGVEHSLLTAVNDNLPTASLLKDGSRRSVFSMKKFNLSSHGNEPVSKSRRNRAARLDKKMMRSVSVDQLPSFSPSYRAQMLLILADACNSHDIDTIYFGSTRERQATMVLSRLVRSNHYSLLSCLPVIAPEIPLPSINAKKLRIMRPLLSTSQV